MRRIIFIVEEFYRSFKKGIFRNILLAVMFSLSLIMTVIMSSYYLDIGDRYARLDAQLSEDELWCNMDYYMSGDITDISENLATDEGCINMMGYYDEIHSLSDSRIISYLIEQPVYLRLDDADALLGKDVYKEFSDEDWGAEPVTVQFGDGDDAQLCSAVYLQSDQFDLEAYKLCGLTTEIGEGFSESNMILDKADAPIPVVLGNDYKDLVDIGSEFDVLYWGYVYRCKVIGILEKGAATPILGYSGVCYAPSCVLDSHVIFPLGIKLSDNLLKKGVAEKNNQESNDTDIIKAIRKYANLDFVSLQNGTVIVKEDLLNRQVDVFREIGEKYRIPSVHLEGVSMGVDMFRKESADSVRIMLIFTIILVCFTFYCLGVTLYDKIRQNKRTYGIYLMNGCSMWMILVSYLLEVFCVLLPSVLVARYIFFVKNVSLCYKDVIVKFAYNCSGFVFVAGTFLIIMLLKGVNIEHIIRQKD